MRRALAIDEAELGPDHPPWVSGHRQSAAYCRNSELVEEAEPLRRRELKITEDGLPDVIRMSQQT